MLRTVTASAVSAVLIVPMAQAVCAPNDELEDLNWKHFVKLIQRMRVSSQDVESCLDYLTASLSSGGWPIWPRTLLMT